jgi:hypothetical protein
MYGGDVVRNRLELLFRQRKLLRNAARTVVQQMAEGLDGQCRFDSHVADRPALLPE